MWSPALGSQRPSYAMVWVTVRVLWLSSELLTGRAGEAVPGKAVPLGDPGERLVLEVHKVLRPDELEGVRLGIANAFSSSMPIGQAGSGKSSAGIGLHCDSELACVLSGGIRSPGQA